MKRKQRLNKAVIQVEYPDGCRHDWITRPTGGMAVDTVAFAKWLAKTADEILECATHQGQRAKQKRPPGPREAGK